jgi:hypothetical protein
VTSGHDWHSFDLVAGRHAITNAQLIELACRERNRPAPRIIAAAEMIEQASAYLPYFDVATRFDDGGRSSCWSRRGA